MPEAVRVLGLGAGGHAKVLLEALAADPTFNVVGFLDVRADLWGATFAGLPVIGGDDLLKAQYHGGVSHVLIGLGGVGDTTPRRRLYERAGAHGFDAVRVIHPQAVVSPSARLEDGVQVLAGAVVGTGVVVAENAIVNTGSVVDHDSRVGAHVHVAPAAALAADVEVGEGAHVGLGARVLQGLRIGAGAIVGAGAVVTQDVAAGATVVGVPARPLQGTAAR